MGEDTLDQRLAVDYYREARRRVRALLHDVDDDAGQRPVPACSTWTVADLVGHLAGLAVAYGSGHVPECDRQAWLEGMGAVGLSGERDGDAIMLGLQLGLRITASDLVRHDLSGIRVLAGGEFIAGTVPIDLTLEASTFEAFRLLGGRRTLAEMRPAAVTGDLERYLPGLVHMPRPVNSLREV